MAFIFSTSHLPETRVRRLDHLEDEEEENDVMQPMPRAGGVRAFSHLPVRDNPAPSTAPLREDSPRRGIAPIPPRSATPSTSGSPMSEAQDDAPPPEPDSAPEDDTAPQDHADDRPWYMPRITAQDLPPQDHPEDAHAPGLNSSTSTTRNNGFSPSPQDLRDDFHAPTPDSPTREAPAQDSRPALPRGRILEKRLPPGLRGLSAGQFQSLAGNPEYHDLVYRPGNAENERHQADGFLQNVADTRTTRQAPSSPKEPQTFAQSVRPAAQPAQKGGQTTAAAPPPSPGNVNATPPTFKVDPADESKKNFMLRTPETQEKHPSDRAFGDHARSIMQDELDKSPIARKLLEHITRMTGKPVIIQMLTDPRDTAHPVYRSDGSIAIAINPTDLRSGTLSHEITHVIQRWASEQALKWAKEQDPEIIKATPPGQEVKLMSKNTQAINSKAREILHSIMPVTYDAERNNGTQDYIENEAMRASHIVNAEISAVNLKAELEAMKNSPKQRDRDHYEWLIKHPANIAEKFWAHQLPMEQAVHATNQGRPIPKGTRYRDYDYVYAKVLDILNSPDTPKEQRVTADHLKWERFHKVKDN